MSNILKLTLLSIVIFASFSSLASQKVGGSLGYTSNANYEDENKDSDFYLKAKYFAYFTIQKEPFNIWTSYKNYFSETHNNVFNWRLGTTRNASVIQLKKWEIDYGVGGQHFTNENPGLSEDSFDLLFIDIALSRSFDLNDSYLLFFETGYDFRYYTDFHGRLDHVIYAGSQLDILKLKRHIFSPHLELGFVLSNNSLYRRNYFEIGGRWLYKLNKDMKIGARISIRATAYPDRTVSTRTTVANNRKTFKTVSQSENETHNLSRFGTDIVKIYRSYNLKGSLDVVSQNSKSGFQDYSYFEFIASITKNF